MGKLFKSKLLSRRSKKILYSSFLRSVLVYVYKSWLTAKGYEKNISIFEKKVLKKIYGPLLKNGLHRISTNKEV